jgi:serine/threonine protein phosphatase PrpC
MAARYLYAQAAATVRLKPQEAARIFEREDALVIVVADGGGGMRGGEAASHRLVAVVETAVNDERFAYEDLEAWLRLFGETDAGLAANRAGETTGIVVVLSARGLIGLSTGDSEAWLVTGDQIDNLTVGQHTRQRLGSSGATPTIFRRPAPREALVVASDGLFKFAARDVIAGIVRAGAVGPAAEQLVELVRLRSGKVAEDVAVVLARPDVRPGEVPS